MADDKTIIIGEKYRYSCTRIKEYQYTWIYKIPSEYIVGQRDDSPKFSTGENNNDYEWEIEMYFGGLDTISKDYVSVHVYSHSSAKIKTKPHFEAMAKLSIIDKNDKQRMEQSVTITKQNFDFKQFPEFMKRDDLLNSPDLLSNNELKLICRISLDIGANLQVFDLKTPWSTLCYRNVKMSNFEKMFDNPELSDFQFVVGGTRIKVHKCILAAHSNVFAAMFQSDMIEKSKSEVEIEDIDVDIMRKLLRFVYVAEVQDVDDFTDKLFIAADKYEMIELKDFCEERLIKKLTIDNLYETLLLVDKYDTTKLRDVAIEFIISNSKKLSDMEAFIQSIENLSSILLVQVIRAFMAKS